MWRPGRLARGTAYVTGWNSWRIGVQALSLIALARLFGAEGYGILAGLIAFFATCAQLVGLGTGIALVRDSSRDPSVRAGRYRQARIVYLLSGLGFFLLAWPIGSWMASGDLSLWTIGALAFAELVAAPAVMPIAFRLQSEERMSAFGMVLSVPPTVRLIAIVTLLLIGPASIGQFAVAYVILIAAASLMLTIIFRPALTQKHFVPHYFRFVREGLPFVLPSISNTAGNELDKTIVLQLAGAAATGPYAAAYRIAQGATLPVQSLVLAAAPRLFRLPRRDVRGFKPYVLAAIVYGGCAAGGLFLAAPLVPLLLGEDFDVSVNIVRLFSLFVLTNALRQVVMAALTTSDAQANRNVAEFASAAAALVLCLLLVPMVGASGAAVSLISGDLVALAYGVISLRKPRHRVEDALFESRVHHDKRL